MQENEGEVWMQRFAKRNTSSASRTAAISWRVTWRIYNMNAHKI